MTKPRLCRNENAKYLKMSEAIKRYSMCNNTLKKVATEGGAFLKIGNAVLIDTSILDSYLREQYTKRA